MAHSDSANADIKDLQTRAQTLDLRRSRAKNTKISRAGHLQAIDILSRWAPGGLAMFAGSTIYLSVIAGRIYPLRAIFWTLMIVCALWYARRLQEDFRSGGPVATRPFRWRATFTAVLCVTATVFASAPLLLIPATATGVLAFQIAAVTLMASVGAGAFFLSHGRALVAAIIPGIVAVAIAALRNGDPFSAMWSIAMGAASLGVFAVFNNSLMRDLKNKHPWTHMERAALDVLPDESRIYSSLENPSQSPQNLSAS